MKSYLSLLKADGGLPVNVAPIYRSKTHLFYSSFNFFGTFNVRINTEDNKSMAASTGTNRSEVNLGIFQSLI